MSLKNLFRKLFRKDTENEVDIQNDNSCVENEENGQNLRSIKNLFGSIILQLSPIIETVSSFV